MSKKNREKRAAKARARRAEGSVPGGRVTPRTPPGPDGRRPGGASASRPPGEGDRVRRARPAAGDLGGEGSARTSASSGNPRPHDEPVDLVDLALYAVLHRDTFEWPIVLDGLVEHIDALVVAITARLRSGIDALWAGGWQPVEVVHLVRRGCSASSVRLLLAGIAVDRSSRDPGILDPRWVAQLDGLDLPDTCPEATWVGDWFAAETDPRAAVMALIELLARLEAAPPIEALIPPPGADPVWRPKLDGWIDDAGSTDPGVEADPVLEKVRALLAKAESTSFEAEAEAFTAKAQELIARHAIDAALLAESRPDHDSPAAIRICLDDPYADAKALLLQVVACSSRCRSLFTAPLAMSTVVGFPADLAAVELLFTSLLVQAQTALAAAARTAPPGARTRSRGFRSAFLLAYANRIGERLDEVNATVVAETEAEQGRSLLPVLASRDAQVEDAVDDLFGANLVTRQVRGGHDAAGWASGRLAADAAELHRSVAEGA